jgi:hypothetical protein
MAALAAGRTLRRITGALLLRVFAAGTPSPNPPRYRNTGGERITVRPISRSLVKSADPFFWQRQLPILSLCVSQRPCSNRARFFG